MFKTGARIVRTPATAPTTGQHGGASGTGWRRGTHLVSGLYWVLKNTTQMMKKMSPVSMATCHGDSSYTDHHQLRGQAPAAWRQGHTVSTRTPQSAVPLGESKHELRRKPRHLAVHGAAPSNGAAQPTLSTQQSKRTPCTAVAAASATPWQPEHSPWLTAQNSARNASITLPNRP